MSSPRERLTRIINNFVPKQAILHALVEGDGNILLYPHTLEDDKWISVDDPLQEALDADFVSCWDSQRDAYILSTKVNTPDRLFAFIVNEVLREYMTTSARSHATKRKTELFFRDVDLDNKLANFVLAAFIKIRSVEYEESTRADKVAFQENFDALRRTYGKKR